MFLLRLLALFLVVAAGAPAVAEPRFEIERDELHVLDPDTGDVAHTLVHGSVWDGKPDPADPPAAPAHPFVGPVVLDDAAYYATRGTVFRLDPDRGVIDRRIPFPAHVVGLEVAENELVVTVEVSLDRWTDAGRVEEVETTLIEFRHRPGAHPPHEIWSGLYFLDAWKDPLNLGLAVGGDPEESTEAQHRTALERLQRVAPQDPQNPFYPLHIGTQHLALGDDAAANAAFERARKTEGAPWFVDLQLAASLDELGRYDDADVAFDRGVRKLDTVHPSFRETWFLVPSIMLMGIWSKDAIDAAVQAEQFDAVDRMQERTHRLLPNLEGSAFAWSQLADWYAANGRDELADKWRKTARSADGPFERYDATSREFDIALTLLIGAAVGTLLMALLVGLRARRRDDKLRPRKRDLAGLAFGIVASLFCLWLVNVALVQIEDFTVIPDEAMYASWGSPNVQRWLESLEPSQPRTELIRAADATRASRQTGSPPPEPLEGWSTLVFDAIEIHARKVSLRGIFTGEAIAYQRVPLGPVIGGWFVAILILLITGAAVRHRAPGVARGLTFVIPGGPSSTGPFSVVVAGLVVAALAAILFGTDTLLTRVAGLPNFGRYFGMSSLPPLEPPTFSRTWAWLSLSAAVGLHLVAATFDWRRSRREDD